MKKHIFDAYIGSEKIIVCQYTPNIQIQSALDPISQKYFLKIFKSKNPNIKEFAHSYVPNDPSGQSMGARMVVYKDGKIVIGKAPNHAYLFYQPSDNRLKIEGYFDAKNNEIQFSGEENSKISSFFKKDSWKSIFSNLLRAKLVDQNYWVSGCPPLCGETTKITVGKIISGDWDIVGVGTTSKSKESENMVRSFLAKKALQNRSSDVMSYLYRYADGKIHSMITFKEYLERRLVSVNGWLSPSGKFYSCDTNFCHSKLVLDTPELKKHISDKNMKLSLETGGVEYIYQDMWKANFLRVASEFVGIGPGESEAALFFEGNLDSIKNLYQKAKDLAENHDMQPFFIDRATGNSKRMV